MINEENDQKYRELVEQFEELAYMLKDYKDRLEALPPVNKYRDTVPEQMLLRIFLHDFEELHVPDPNEPELPL